jgi:hypothetical protein
MIGGSAMMFHLSKSMFKPFQQEAPTTQQQKQQQQQVPQGASGRRDMRGPGIDLASLGKGLDISSILGTLQQQQQPFQQMMMMNNGGGGGSMQGSDDVSDIISIASEIRDLEISTTATGGGRKKRGRSASSSNKKELVL